LWLKPHAHDCLPHRNVWSLNSAHHATGLFFGHFQNMSGAMDRNGNSNYGLANELDTIQDKIKKEGTDINSYTKWRAERARVPEEALVSGGHNLFSAYHNRVNRAIERIELDKDVQKLATYGAYIRESGRVILQTNEQIKQMGGIPHPPINDVPALLPRGYDLHGCITEWHPPFQIHDIVNGYATSYVPKGMYYIWHDPYATDKDADEIKVEDSIGAAYVYEASNIYSPTKGDRIVASWLGRPDTVDEYNEQLFLLAERYNAQMMFENDRGSVYEYALSHKLLRFLMSEPSFFSLKEIAGTTGRKFGVSIGKNLNRKTTGAILFRDQLGHKIGTNSIGEEVQFIDVIYCKRLLREILYWKNKGNFDCVSACIVGMFQIRETHDLLINVSPPGNHEAFSFFNRKFFQ